jgi:hypothetical protein
MILHVLLKSENEILVPAACLLHRRKFNWMRNLVIQ